MKSWRRHAGVGRIRSLSPAIGVAAGKVISKYKTGKHFDSHHDTRLTVARRQAQIEEEAALDGFYVLRTPLPASQLDAPGVVTAYKNLKYVERDFATQGDDLDCGPSTTTSKNASGPTC